MTANRSPSSMKRTRVIRPPRQRPRHWKEEVGQGFFHVRRSLMVSEFAATFPHYLGDDAIRRELRSPMGNKCITVQYKPATRTLCVSGSLPGYCQDLPNVTCMDLRAQTFAMYRAANRECNLGMPVEVGRELCEGSAARLTGLTVDLLLPRAEGDVSGVQLANLACAAVRQGVGTAFFPLTSVRLTKGPRIEEITISDSVRGPSWKFPDAVGVDAVRRLTQTTLVVRIRFTETSLKRLAEQEQEQPTPSFFSHDFLAQRVTWVLSQFAPWNTALGEFLASEKFVSEPWQSVDSRLLYQLNMDNVRSNLQAQS